jgi:hypothetical protein
MRYCAMQDYSDIIFADNGDWSETEVLGNYAIVKVRASDATLDTIAGAQGFLRIPPGLDLSTPLSSLTIAQINAIHDRILAMGYTDAEIQAALGNNLRNRTLGQVLRFAASRRLKPRYDAIADQIVLDGSVQSCRLVDDVDTEIQ